MIISEEKGTFSILYNYSAIWKQWSKSGESIKAIKELVMPKHVLEIVISTMTLQDFDIWVFKEHYPSTTFGVITSKS